MKRINVALSSRNVVRNGIVLFLLALLVRVVVIIHFHPYTDLGRYELERTAISLAHSGVYGNPYALPTGPTAHVSPGYTLILAALFHLFGTGISAEIIKELLSSTVTSIGIALLPSIAAALRLEARAGWFAGLIMALYPARPLVEIDGDWETPYTMLALMLIAVLAAHLWFRRDLRTRTAVRHGLCWGIAILFVSALLPLFVAFAIVNAIPERLQLGRYASFVGVQIIVLAACLAPWVIRNYLVLGAPVVTRTNPGIELRISNNDSAVADQRENYLHGLFNRYHPLQSPTEAMKVRQMGEIEYNRQAMAEARQWIREHPKRFIELTVGRIRRFWFYVDPTSRVKTAFCWIVDFLGIAGLIISCAQKRVAGYILGVIALVYPLPNYLVHVGLRQSYPVEWLMLLLGVALVSGSVLTRGAAVPELVANPS